MMLQQRLIAPSVLLSLERVDQNDHIWLENGELHISAMTRITELASSQVAIDFCPALTKAARLVGNVRIRNQGTIGGNLCSADYAADPPAILSALGTRICILGPDGQRELPIQSFFGGFYTTELEAGEIVTSIVVPRWQRASYQKFLSVSAEGRPVAAVGAAAELIDGNVVKKLQVSVGAAVENPQRLADTEKMAAGQLLSDELIASIAGEYAAKLDPISDVRGSAWYRREMIQVFVKRALVEVRNGSR